jgi:hypothetical protein
LHRSRGNGAATAAEPGTTRRARKRRFVRSVRRAGPDSPGAPTANRSITDECSTTSGTAGASPAPSAKSASLPAAHNSDFARSRLPGPAAATTVRANSAASGDTADGRQAAR